MIQHILALLLITAPHIDALRLLIISQGMNSHIIMFNRLATVLTQEGHDVSVLLPNNTKHSTFNPDVDLHTYRGIGETHIMSSTKLSEHLLKIKYSASTREYVANMLDLFSTIQPTVLKECELLMDDEVQRERMLNKHFDFAIVDHIGMPCLMNYPVMLGLDYFLFSVPCFTWFSRVPDLPSFSPDIFAAKHTDEMSFLQRFENGLHYLLTYTMFVEPNPIDMTKYPPGKPILSMGELQRRALFWFWFDDPSLSLPRPRMPNIVSVGDFMVQDAKPLPEHFQQFLDQAPGGAILVSFGSFFDHVPDDCVVKLCNSFAQISQKIIWKSNFQPPCAEELKGKMMIVNWTPQNDILAHPNLRLFITHCGLNSLMESVYHATPMIGFPIAFDQPYNGKILEAKQYGIAMDLAHFSTEELIGNINHIIGNKDIARSVRFGSDLIRDKPERPEKRISYWLEHVARHGADHLRTGAYKLSVLEFLMLDVLLAYVVIIVIVIIIFISLVYCLCRCVKRCCCSRDNAKKTKVD